MNGARSIGIMLSVKLNLIFQESVRQAKRLQRRKLIINCRATSAPLPISVSAISSSLVSSMALPVSAGTSGKGCGIDGLWIERSGTTKYTKYTKNI